MVLKENRALDESLASVDKGEVHHVTALRAFLEADCEAMFLGEIDNFTGELVSAIASLLVWTPDSFETIRRSVPVDSCCPCVI